MLDAPSLLADHHEIEGFQCTQATLEIWLKQRARKNQIEGASRTFVVCDDAAVVGYYCLSAGSVTRDVVTGRLRRNMPDPIPVVVLGRLAVDTRWASQGIGRGLVKDAVVRTSATRSLPSGSDGG